jgi:hypothetical protein
MFVLQFVQYYFVVVLLLLFAVQLTAKELVNGLNPIIDM